MQMLPFPQDDSPIQGEKIRKEWHKGEWYFSVIDVIAELLETDHPRAKSYWSTLKQRLKVNGENIPHLQLIKVVSVDGKSRSTDFTNEQGFKDFQSLLGHNLKNRRGRMQVRRDDEVVHFHPKVTMHLKDRGWKVEHHIRLNSGNIIDFVAYSPSQTYVIECKPKLANGKLYSAIGQVLCYRLEYDVTAIPAIAAYSSSISDYTRQSCKALGIELMPI